VLDPLRCWRDGRLDPVPLEGGALLARPERIERTEWLQARRRHIPATIRLMLDATTTCMDGVTPVGIEVTEPLLAETPAARPFPA